MIADKINIQLTKNEALVLFEFTNRLAEKQIDGLFEDKSELRAIGNLECLLEKELPELFVADYENIIKKARESLLEE